MLEPNNKLDSEGVFDMYRDMAERRFSALESEQKRQGEILDEIRMGIKFFIWAGKIVGAILGLVLAYLGIRSKT